MTKLDQWEKLYSVDKTNLKCTLIAISFKNANIVLIFLYFYRKQGSWGKVILSHGSVILFTGEGVPTTGGALVLGGVPALRGVWSGGGTCSRGSGPRVGGCLFLGGLVLEVPAPGGSGAGGLQVHTQGGCWGGSGPGPHPRGKLRGSSPDPHPRGKLRGIWFRPTSKGKLRGIWLGVWDPPTATVADSTHPTGMHSCHMNVFVQCTIHFGIWELI